MMSAHKTLLPDDSILHQFVGPDDFLDCYANECGLDVDGAARRAMKFPAWVGFLMALRNLMMKPFGLRTSAPKGDRIGYFPVVRRGADEILLGFNDRHLDFRIAFLRRDKLAYFATWVRPHNLLGRAYLWMVLPFHRVIVRNAMARVSGP